jgi:NAD(P)H-dependent FMN reductase
MYLVISTSLHPQSNSRTLALRAFTRLKEAGEPTEFLDLRETPLPFCNGDDCYRDPQAQQVAKQIRAARGILLATPIYNYQVSSAAKNLVELTGKAWEDSVVGFLCAAGGKSSYMSIMSLANSLMLDFRTLVLPRFVYTTEDDFEGESIRDPNIEARLNELIDQLQRVTTALYPK